MSKFQRRFELTIQPPADVSPQAIVITSPLTCTVEVVRNTLASANTCNLTIYNLAPKTRNAIFKDRYNTLAYWGVKLRGGYNRMYTMFQGNILRSESYKDGTDWVTEIEALDGLDAIQNGFVSQTVAEGNTEGDAIQSLTGSLGTVFSGFFGEETTEAAQRGRVMFGPTTDVLDDVTGGNYFIDNETLNVLGEREVIAGIVTKIDSRQLLQTPRRNDTYLDVEVLFTPELTVGQVIALESRESIFDGEYKCEGFRHQVTFSEAVPGDAITTMNLFTGAGALRGVR